jgi:DNA-cytosine methyltransferase
MKQYKTLARELNILSLFDGLSGGQIVISELFKKRGYNYYASEIEKYALTICAKNFPNTIQLGDVTDVDFKKLPKISLLMAGFPCQSYSYAGKREGVKSKSGALIFQVFRAIEEASPDLLFLENVKGLVTIDKGETFKEILRTLNTLGYLVDFIQINSALLSAQNRERVYIVGRKIDKTKQEKEGVVFNLSTGNIKEKLRGKYSTKQDIDYGLHGTDANSILLYKSGICQPEDREIEIDEIIEIRETYCFGHHYVGGAMRGRYLIDGKRQDGKGSVAKKTKQYIELRSDKKTNCLTTVGKDNQLIYTDSIKKRHELSELSYRLLTPLECERLQTLPEGYTDAFFNSKKISNSRRCQVIGNGWTIDVVSFIINKITSNVSL